MGSRMLFGEHWSLIGMGFILIVTGILYAVVHLFATSIQTAGKHYYEIEDVRDGRKEYKDEWGNVIRTEEFTEYVGTGEYDYYIVTKEQEQYSIIKHNQDIQVGYSCVCILSAALTIFTNGISGTDINWGVASIGFFIGIAAITVFLYCVAGADIHNNLVKVLSSQIAKYLRIAYLAAFGLFFVCVCIGDEGFSGIGDGIAFFTKAFFGIGFAVATLLDKWFSLSNASFIAITIVISVPLLVWLYRIAYRWAEKSFENNPNVNKSGVIVTICTILFLISFFCYLPCFLFAPYQENIEEQKEIVEQKRVVTPVRSSQPVKEEPLPVITYHSIHEKRYYQWSEHTFYKVNIAFRCPTDIEGAPLIPLWENWLHNNGLKDAVRGNVDEYSKRHMDFTQLYQQVCKSPKYIDEILLSGLTSSLYGSQIDAVTAERQTYLSPSDLIVREQIYIPHRLLGLKQTASFSDEGGPTLTATRYIYYAIPWQRALNHSDIFAISKRELADKIQSMYIDKYNGIISINWDAFCANNNLQVELNKKKAILNLTAFVTSYEGDTQPVLIDLPYKDNHDLFTETVINWLSNE